jgi:hypothetical protein
LRPATQPGGPGPRIYIPHEPVAQLHPQALGSLFVASYGSGVLFFSFAPKDVLLSVLSRDTSVSPVKPGVNAYYIHMLIQAGRSRVRFALRSLDLSIHQILGPRHHLPITHLPSCSGWSIPTSTHLPSLQCVSLRFPLLLSSYLLSLSS